MMARQPRWAEELLSLRNLLVAPLGLKTSGASPEKPRDMIGIFAVALAHCLRGFDRCGFRYTQKVQSQFAFSFVSFHPFNPKNLQVC